MTEGCLVKRKALAQQMGKCVLWKALNLGIKSSDSFRTNKAFQEEHFAADHYPLTFKFHIKI